MPSAGEGRTPAAHPHARPENRTAGGEADRLGTYSMPFDISQYGRHLVEVKKSGGALRTRCVTSCAGSTAFLSMAAQTHREDLEVDVIVSFIITRLIFLTRACLNFWLFYFCAKEFRIINFFVNEIEIFIFEIEKFIFSFYS